MPGNAIKRRTPGWGWSCPRPADPGYARPADPGYAGSFGAFGMMIQSSR